MTSARASREAQRQWIFAMRRLFPVALLLLANGAAGLRAPRVHELIQRVKGMRAGDRRLLVGTSFSGGAIPTPNVVLASDFLLLHGNGIGEPTRIGAMVREARAVPGYRPMPILFNEDDHYAFERPSHNMLEALASYASWGYFEGGRSDYATGYQCPPVNWTVNTARKRAFFERVREIAGLPIGDR